MTAVPIDAWPTTWPKTIEQLLPPRWREHRSLIVLETLADILADAEEHVRTEIDIRLIDDDRVKQGLGIPNASEVEYIDGHNLPWP